MSIGECSKAHKNSGFPVRPNKNICAGGDKSKHWIFISYQI